MAEATAIYSNARSYVLGIRIHSRNLDKFTAVTIKTFGVVVVDNLMIQLGLDHVAHGR